MTTKNKRKYKKLGKRYYIVAIVMQILMLICFTGIIYGMIADGIKNDDTNNSTVSFILNNANEIIVISLSLFAISIVIIGIGFHYISKRHVYKLLIKKYRQESYFSKILVLIQMEDEKGFDEVSFIYNECIDKNSIEKNFLHGYILQAFAHSKDELRAERANRHIYNLRSEYDYENLYAKLKDFN